MYVGLEQYPVEYREGSIRSRVGYLSDFDCSYLKMPEEDLDMFYDFCAFCGLSAEDIGYFEESEK